MGELLALQWQDVDWKGRFIEVRRNFTHWQLTTPKSRESCRVDMSWELAQTLKDVLVERQIDAGATGTDIPPGSFRTRQEASCTRITSAIVCSMGC